MAENRDRTATSTLITTESLNNGHQYVVTSGLKPGDVIIAKGAGLVQEGQKVKGEK